MDRLSDRRKELTGTIASEEQVYRTEKAANREATYRAARARYNAAVDELALVDAEFPDQMRSINNLDQQLTQIEAQMQEEVRQLAQQESRGRSAAAPTPPRRGRTTADPVPTPTSARQTRSKRDPPGEEEPANLGPAATPCERCAKKGEPCLVAESSQKLKDKSLGACLACRKAKLGCSGVSRELFALFGYRVC